MCFAASHFSRSSALLPSFPPEVVALPSVAYLGLRAIAALNSSFCFANSASFFCWAILAASISLAISSSSFKILRRSSSSNFLAWTLASSSRLFCSSSLFNRSFSALILAACCSVKTRASFMSFRRTRSKYQITRRTITPPPPAAIKRTYPLSSAPGSFSLLMAVVWMTSISSMVLASNSISSTTTTTSTVLPRTTSAASSTVSFTFSSLVSTFAATASAAVLSSVMTI
mmetsp:Transcript_25594/g.48085  ORF Transcript_25594/g.48085 Transcript_25594/m.48085 type:complete len:229 (-) Transcript_25594:4581-5267(-)